MAIHYHCRHCGVKLGSLDQVAVDSQRLGLHTLSDEERQDMVTYNSKGDIQIKSICEDCQESLEKNPEYYQNDFLIH
ncbi:anti-sigma-F factor Fin family protein [Bacillus tuaregi]|uniref:anti-sigma-F factor Fin family protein n=1 Tax=Bacillus tuaregi TaxID=1816695 RepID=UPI0008F94114|nr:anti-sigma-F factor Fin family protein [Bacillus tuaregi]